ncbi:sensor histidine kinase [Actinoallomurus liliacearum]|uniref:sensor histidine kinase n=1 Tax=Actinoallomurus liliacearum TaxID=1080073 RepID=UPI0031F002AB
MVGISVEAVLAATAALMAAAAGWSLGSVRRRDGPGAPGGEATFAVLHTISLASASLRTGLTEESARRAARHLRELLGVPAVAVTDTERLLAWDGAGDAHSETVVPLVAQVLGTGRPRVVVSELIACGDPDCPIRAAVIAPLTIEGRVAGALAAYGAGVRDERLQTLGEVARWASGQLELAELESSKTRLMEAEMRALRAQISPHFVYNSLTTIASFIRTDPERARELLLDFADFARYSFRDRRDFTTLAEELRSIHRYLLLERARFGDERLRFTVEIAPEVLPVAVPFLSLQPLVENAIRHGMRCGGMERLHVRIVAGDAGAEAAISVEDDGVGMDPGRLRDLLAEGRESAPHGGIGLVNVDHRLRQVYGEKYGLVIETAVGAGMKVSLRVPKSHTAVASR